jgi:hypothetical protein
MAHELDELEDTISRYLHEHRYAAETSEGAHRHWLLGQPRSWTVDQVREVLRRMTRAGLLEEHALPGGATLYRLRRAESGT